MHIKTFSIKGFLPLGLLAGLTTFLLTSFSFAREPIRTVTGTCEKKNVDKKGVGVILDNMPDVKQTIKDLIKGKGSLRKVARDLSLDHGNLCRSLSADSNPRLQTIEKLLGYLGYEIRIVKSKKLTK